MRSKPKRPLSKRGRTPLGRTLPSRVHVNLTSREVEDALARLEGVAQVLAARPLLVAAAEAEVGTRVPLLRVLEELVPPTLLDDLALAHEGGLVCHQLHRGGVHGEEEEGRAELELQGLQQTEP